VPVVKNSSEVEKTREDLRIWNGGYVLHSQLHDTLLGVNEPPRQPSGNHISWSHRCIRKDRIGWDEHCPNPSCIYNGDRTACFMFFVLRQRYDLPKCLAKTATGRSLPYGTHKVEYEYSCSNLQSTTRYIKLGLAHSSVREEQNIVLATWQHN